MELLYLYWICLPLRRLPGGLWLPNLTFSVCYGALSMETLWASEVRFTYTKYLNSILTFASQELRAFIDKDLSVNQVCHNIKFFILFIFSFGISGVAGAAAGLVRHHPYQILDLNFYPEESPHFCSTLVWQW